MIFTKNQIENLLSIIDFNTSMFISTQMGVDVLSTFDKYILNKFGFDVKKITEKYPPYLQSFMWGQLTGWLNNNQANSVSYSDFQKYLKTGQYFPLTTKERNLYDIAVNRSYKHIKNLSNKRKDHVTKLISDEDLKHEISEGISKRKSIQNIVSELGNKSGDWQRDYGRIVETEMNTIFQQGRATTLEKRFGEDVEVFKETYPLACRHCIRLHLTAGIGSKPIVLPLSVVQANGTNIGRKVADWKFTVDSVHPFCFDKDTDVLTKDGWINWTNVTGKESFLSINPDSLKSEWVDAIRLVKYKYNGVMSHFKGRSFDLMTTQNHKHFIKSKSSKKGGNSYYKYSLKEESEFLKSYSFVNNIKDNWEGQNFSEVKISKTITLNIEDYLKLMGWFLSDGSISKPKHAVKWQLKITQEKSKNFEEIESLLRRCFGKVWVAKGAFYSQLDNDTSDYFLQFGHAYDKFIPNDIKILNTELIKIFLIAFCKGDGSVRKRSNKYINSKEEIYYSTSSPKMASDIGELIIKIGLRPSYFYIKPKPTKFKNGIYTSKHVQINIYQTRSLSSQMIKIEKKDVFYDDYVYDVELKKNHTLFVKRNGKVTVSGNCRCNLKHKPKGTIWSDEKGMFIYPEKYERKIERKNKIKIQVGDKNFEV